MEAIILAQAGENVQCLPVFITLLLVSSDRSSLGYDKQTNKQTSAKKETNQCNLMLQRNNLMQQFSHAGAHPRPQNVQLLFFFNETFRYWKTTTN